VFPFLKPGTPQFVIGFFFFENMVNKVNSGMVNLSDEVTLAA
jgi:hypothetical protein